MTAQGWDDLTEEQVKELREDWGDYRSAREPQFAPEGEPDDYRDSAEYLAGNEDGPIRLELWLRWSGKVAHDITTEQAQHILAYLSEQNRTGDRS